MINEDDGVFFVLISAAAKKHEDIHNTVTEKVRKIVQHIVLLFQIFFAMQLLDELETLEMRWCIIQFFFKCT